LLKIKKKLYCDQQFRILSENIKKITEAAKRNKQPHTYEWFCWFYAI